MAELPDTRYATTDDGVYLAYQMLGDGPTTLVWQPDWPGNIDFEWADPNVGQLLRELASFVRVIVHDQRGIGLSSRNVPLPDLETRAADLRRVLDAAGVDQAVLVGSYTSGGVNALLAATHPARVQSLVWIEPSPRALWAPDYPWGVGADYHKADLAALAFWGTNLYGAKLREYQRAFGNELPETVESTAGRQTRNACTPDVAEVLSEIWYATDVRGILTAVKCPTLLLARGEFAAGTEAGYTASLMPNTTTVAMPEGEWSADHIATEVRAIRSFVGLDVAPHLDSVLASVLFTDIVGSTAKQADLGDSRWKHLLERHHVIVREEIAQWRGSEVDTAGDGFYATFEGPTRAVRCALAIVAGVRDLGLEIRAGVHIGECTVMDGKVGGLPVTIGARIAARAGASEVLVSQTVKDLVPGSGLDFEDAGEHELKGVPDRWHLYRVVS